MMDYATRIHMHLEQYHLNHCGKLPEVIFMSSELFYILVSNDSHIELYNRPDGFIATFHRVPIKLYESSKLEYHLVESSGKFD